MSEILKDVSLVKDVFPIIIFFIDDPTTYFNTAIACKYFNKICNDKKLLSLKKEQFCRKVTRSISSWNGMHNFLGSDLVPRLDSHVVSINNKVPLFPLISVPIYNDFYAMNMEYGVLPNGKKHGKAIGKAVDYTNHIICELYFENNMLNGEVKWYRRMWNGGMFNKKCTYTVHTILKCVVKNNVIDGIRIECVNGKKENIYHINDGVIV